MLGTDRATAHIVPGPTVPAIFPAATYTTEILPLKPQVFGPKHVLPKHISRLATILESGIKTLAALKVWNGGVPDYLKWQAVPPPRFEYPLTPDILHAFLHLPARSSAPSAQTLRFV